MTPKFDQQFNQFINEDWKDKAKALGLAGAITAAGLPLTGPLMKKAADKITGNKPQEVRKEIKPTRTQVDQPQDWRAGPIPPHLADAPANNQLQIDWQFIAEREGEQIRELYVPRQNGGTTGPAEGRSGVTIASGFDIGQHTEQEIRDLFAGHEDIITRLLPFADAIQQDAINLLNNREIDTSDLEVDQVATIDGVVNADRSEEVEQTYNGASDMEFNELPSQMQTVIASVAFQYGINGIQTQDFWQQVINGQWQEALANLRNFGDRYPTRRNLEADILQQGIEEINQPNIDH
tara:strand:+ start:1707 stop:2585 length:879 start_codon:yes stop_codon:yes gene_type:complete